VSLSGDGGDEIFGGYQTHRMGHQMDLLRRVPRPVRTVASKLPIKKNLSGTTNLYTLKEAFRLSLLEPEQFYSDALSHDTYRPAIFRKLTRERLAYCLTLSDGSLGESLRLYDLLFNTLGDHYLVKVDRASMAVGLEVRCPFLDYRLLEYSQRLPAQWKADAFSMKKFMRLLIKDIVPKEIVTRGKKGFTPPIDKWILDEKHKPTIERGLLTLRTLHPPAVEFYERVVSDSNKLYTLYKIRLFLFQLWWERWMQ
jgi:asparagine synthase (glutamine-hydrolysing)